MARKFLNLKANRRQTNVKKAHLWATNRDRAKASNQVPSLDFSQSENSQYLALL